MKLKQQVTSLELSKKLKELGVEQNSYFAWVLNNCDANIWDETMWESYDGPNKPEILACAFTVAELGEMLPLEKCFIDIQGNEEDSWYFHVKDDRGFQMFVEDAETEANARAKMLIYLLENKLI